MTRYCEWCDEPIPARRASIGAKSCTNECAREIRISYYRLRRDGEIDPVGPVLAGLNPLAVAWGRGQKLAPVDHHDTHQGDQHE